jgi:sugar lactone lactonase YvrE
VRALELSQLRTLAAGLDHPEGIALGPDGMLYAGGEAGQVYRVDPGTGTHEQIASTDGFALGICLDAAGSVYVCDPGNHAVMRVDAATGAVEPWCQSAAGGPLATPNWAAFASDGSMWLSDSGTEAVDVRDGRLLHVPAGGGEAELIELEPLHFPNGLCIGPEGLVYWLESFTPRLRRLTDAGPELVADLPGVVPDGVVLDMEGGFLVCCYYPFRLLRVAPGGGAPQLLLDDPFGIHMIMPTNAAHYGPGLEQLAVAGLGGYEIKALPAPVPGAPLHYP